MLLPSSLSTVASTGHARGADDLTPADANSVGEVTEITVVASLLRCHPGIDFADLALCMSRFAAVEMGRCHT